MPATFDEAVETCVKLLADVMPASKGNQDQRRGQAVGLVSSMVGTLLLSRAVADAAPALAEGILTPGKRVAKIC